ncbi:MAG: SOS response-associated peptidase [Candidatus Omnitrophica bacterium]|nr:SOS response-associated peptidase [Candidatus Omnitrophota bacterium]
MCGRYGYTNKDNERIKKLFRLKKIDFDLVPRYNIIPGQNVPVILNESPKELTQAKWGLVPFWAKDEKIGYKMINARAETIFEKPSFRNAIKKKRCLILADYFFEWKRTEKQKQPFCIKLKTHETFAFAGIWETWQDKLISCSIITTAPNKLMEKIHDRMPVILPKGKEEEWLNETDMETVKKLLTSYKAADMETYEVSTLVNSPANNSPEILIPVQ